MVMGVKLHKYWQDILLPIVRRDAPPTIPQAVVIQAQQVLLVKRDNPALWELPGGGIMGAESPEETVQREVREETGITVEVLELLGWYERTGFRPHYAPVYVCRPLAGSLRPHAEEALSVRYFPLHALPRSLFPWYKSILQVDLYSATPRPVQRRQHVGLRTLCHCLTLDIGSRLGWLD
jgi:ADP-ribose pyrophosphatase YjhB (NUDIX family)